MNNENKCVIVDMGHAKSTLGKRSPDNSFFEWQFNRILGRNIVNKLEQLGYTVKTSTRESEDLIEISLTERCRRINEIVNKFGVDNTIVVSIHSNAAGNGNQWCNARGWSVFVSKNASDNSKRLANLLFDEAKKEFTVRPEAPNQKYWRANFTLLTKTLCPSVLTENLFYDNKADLELLKDPKVIEKLAQLHVNAIQQYFVV